MSGTFRAEVELTLMVQRWRLQIDTLAQHVFQDRISEVDNMMDALSALSIQMGSTLQPGAPPNGPETTLTPAHTRNGSQQPPILSRYSFFHGFLTFDETVEVLKNKDIYSYLFRFSRSQPESLVVAWKATTGQVKQALLFSQPNDGGYQKALEGQFVSGVASQTG